MLMKYQGRRRTAEIAGTVYHLSYGFTLDLAPGTVSAPDWVPVQPEAKPQVEVPPKAKEQTPVANKMVGGPDFTKELVRETEPHSQAAGRHRAPGPKRK